MIIMDYSGIALASIIINKTFEESLIRHMILNSIRMYRSRYIDEYGEIVLACDGPNNWRRSAFPQYKANRKKGRDESTFDWNEAFRILHLVREEIKENFPYKVIHIDQCEADDIIGTLVDLKSDVPINPEPIMIVSSDRDFVQLQRFPNVKQYSPILKKEVVESNPRLFLQTHIIKGDKGDGVPNILSEDNVFVEGFRQTPMSKKKIDNIIEDLDDGELLYAASWYRNYCRNKKLIDLTETPNDLKRQIINSFEEQDPWSNKGNVFPYLVSKNCNELIKSVQEFV
jgi:5'-3' exonuclease|tara:strand:- start:5265 stop:6119 length:855 start_codon:yes stop_codon:yes gene_type:complete